MTMTDVRDLGLDCGRLPYEAPTVESLGSLGDLTRGAGPGNKPIVMQTGIAIPGMATPTLTVDI
ncbi:MAG TPA: lasso RiPP family leader peptide-containing protein [Pilimelia sp.]|nr:lasso RiPP family leader peptide-containing protein [Pilimelia sp.]